MSPILGPMAHRDDVDALRLRIEAQERDLRDAKAELDVLQAAARANAAAAHDPSENSGSFGMGFGPAMSNGPSHGPGGGSPMSPLRLETQRRLGLLILLITTLVTGLFLSTTHCPSHARRDISRANPSAVPASSDGERVSPFVRFARVIDPGVPAAVPLDQSCAVEVTPVHGSMFDCRVVVRCDDQVLYGESSAGYNHCGPVPSRIVDGDVSRDDGDPALEVDFASGRVVIEERVGLGTQRVELQIID